MKLRERLLCQLRVTATRDWQLVPGGDRRGEPARHLLVIAPRPLPTVDYYLADLLTGDGAVEHRLVFDDDVERWSGAHPAESIQPGTRVVLVRMPSSRWADVIDAAGQRVVEVVWLLDDDVLAARDDEFLPVDYRLRLLNGYVTFKRSFARLIDRVWASTPAIAQRFPPERVELRPPRALVLTRARARWLSIFYHGTGAHRGEHTFLLPVFQEVQRRSQETVIEVVGDHALYRMFRSVPRLRVIHPMRWPDYLAHLRSGKYDIGLVPLLDTPFNRARSGIKALELAAIGAHGLLSRRPPLTECAALPKMQLVGDDPKEWVERILSLVTELGSGD